MKKSYILYFCLFFTTIISAQTIDCNLEILNVEFPISVQPRQIVQVTATVRNNNNTISDATTIGVYSTTYGSRMPGPIPSLVGEVAFLPLQPNEERTLTFEVEMPKIFREYIEMLGQKSRRWSVFVGERQNFADRNCEYPIEFAVAFLPVNLEMRLLTEDVCIEENATLEYQITNLGNETVGPLFISGEACALLGPTQLYNCTRTIEEIPAGQSVIFTEKYNYLTERTPFYGTDRYVAYINQNFSNVINANEHNGAGVSLDTAPYCPSFELERALCYALGFYTELDKIYVSGLLTDYAKVEIIGANTNWQVQTICEGACDGNTVITDLKAGNYTVKVLLNGADGSTCYEERQITVDGISNPTTPQSANCNDLVFTAIDNQIEVQNLNTTFSQIQIIGENTDWQVVTICSGNCAENQVIPSLEAGEYNVKVQLNGNDGSNCYREEKVTVSDDGGNNGDGGNPTGVNCTDMNFTTENGQITVSGLIAASEKIEIIGQNTDWQIVEICNGNCANEQIISELEAGEYSVKVNQFGRDGSYCYREEKIVVNDGGGNNNSNGLADCAGLVFSTPATEQILVEGLTAAYNKVEIIGYQTDWQVRTICDGDCEEGQTIFPLVSGFVAVKVSQVGSDGKFCYREEELKVIQSGRTRSAQNIAKEITLFPNPVKSTLQLNTTQLNGKIARIEVFNGYGQSVLQIPQKTFSSTIETIDVQTLPNGFYYLTIEAENTRLVTKRFIVESYK